MMAAIKAEFRKLLTVRSTYVVLGFALALEVFFAFYVTGFKASAADLHNPGTLASEVTSAISILATVIALVGVLLLTHEYRYNTIMYTLTASKSRTKVLLSKIFVISVFAVVFSLLFGFLSPVFAALGFHASGHTLVHQSLPVWSLIGRVIFTGWGFSMLALIFATIIRIQVGSVAALFLIPGTIEPLLGLLLKKNQVYLPFNSLNAVLERNPQLSYTHAAMVAAIYIIAGWIIAWVLFVRRDAN